MGKQLLHKFIGTVAAILPDSLISTTVQTIAIMIDRIVFNGCINQGYAIGYKPTA